MNLHKEPEEFLSSALFAFLAPEEETARRITLLIYRNHLAYNFSFMEMESGDCLTRSKMLIVKNPEAPMLPEDYQLIYYYQNQYT